MEQCFSLALVENLRLISWYFVGLKNKINQKRSIQQILENGHSTHIMRFNLLGLIQQYLNPSFWYTNLSYNWSIWDCSLKIQIQQPIKNFRNDNKNFEFSKIIFRT